MYYSVILRKLPLVLIMNKKTTIALIGVASLLFSGLAQAGALLRITPIGVAVDEQTVTDPVPIPAGDGGFRLSYWGNGNQADLVDPVLVILATPEGYTPTLADGPGSDPIGLTAAVSTSAPGTYGGSWGADGYAGVFDSSATGSVYDYLGLYYKGNGSNNYSNWSGASDLTSWDIWVFQVDFTPDFGQGDWNEFVSNLTGGSFIVGYGCSGTTTVDTTTVCDGQGKTKSTPFTFTGYVVPEPGTVDCLA